jgi:hypothetical protein
MCCVQSKQLKVNNHLRASTCSPRCEIVSDRGGGQVMWVGVGITLKLRKCVVSPTDPHCHLLCKMAHSANAFSVKQTTLHKREASERSSGGMPWHGRGLVERSTMVGVDRVAHGHAGAFSGAHLSRIHVHKPHKQARYALVRRDARSCGSMCCVQAWPRGERYLEQNMQCPRSGWRVLPPHSRHAESAKRRAQGQTTLQWIHPVTR